MCIKPAEERIAKLPAACRCQCCPTQSTMIHLPKHRSAQAFEQLYPTLLVDARRLQQAFEAGCVQPLLGGKKIGLLCKQEHGVEATLFRIAAEELDAHVAHIRPSLTELSTPLEVQRTAQLIGRLYDAVECQNLALSLVQQLRKHAGIPVYHCIASPYHPIARCVALLGGTTALADKRRFVLQAALLQSIQDL